MKTNLMLVLMVAAILGGCNSDQAVQSTIDNTSALGVIVNGTEYLTAEEVKQYYQQSNSSGLVRLMRVEKNICGWNTNGTFGPFDYYDSQLTDAIFWNAGGRVSVGDHFVLNGMPIKQYGNGSAYANLGGDFVAPVYFGGQMNRFEFSSNTLFGGFKDSLVFGAPIHITNVKRLDTVSSSQDLIVHWVGGSPQGKIKVRLSASREIDGYVNNGETTGIQFFVSAKADNTIIIPKQLIQMLNTTKVIGRFYDLSLSTAEPKTIIAPNGKQIGVLGVSEHKVTVVVNH